MTPRSNGSLYPDQHPAQAAASFDPYSPMAEGNGGYDNGSTYSQSPGRPTLYSDPSAPSLGRPVGGVRQSFESTTGGGGGSGHAGVVGSPFADNAVEGSSGASLRPRKAHGAGAGQGQRESLFNDVYNNSGSRSVLPPPL